MTLRKIIASFWLGISTGASRYIHCRWLRYDKTLHEIFGWDQNYSTVGVYAGQSINYYDLIEKKWHQHWVGSSGDVYNYIETKRAAGLQQFESDFMTRSREVTLSSLTFTLNEDGTVRQLFESFNDKGKTWLSAFNGTYKKVVKD